MIKVFVWSKLMVESVGKFNNNTLVISITSPGQEPANIEGMHVFKFQFHDVTEEYFLENQNRIIRPMEKEIAESIAEIVMSNRDCDRWIIHCEAGISRSPGVAIGLASYIVLNPTREELIELFPCYNKHVCTLIEDAMEIRMKELTEELHVQKLLMEGR